MTTKRKTPSEHAGISIGHKTSANVAARESVDRKPKTSKKSEVVIIGTSTKYQSALKRLAKK